MFLKKYWKRMLVLMICFSMFFALTSFSFAGIFDLGKALFNWVFTKIMNWYTKVLLALGDAILHLIVGSVGETVTIDKLVFNEVKKVDVDFWQVKSTNSFGYYMKNTINLWYNVFLKIALLVDLIILLYVGIQILLSSTGAKKARYQELLKDWFVGIMILFLFPVVMKYVVMLNNATVKAIGSIRGTSSGGESGSLAHTSFWLLIPKYGTEEFAHYIGDTSTDIMAKTRLVAAGGDVGETEDGEEEDIDTSRVGLVLAAIYLIMIGQTVAILIIYYKRAFMVAFLITIFPLVAMSYVIDRMRRWQESNI